MYKQITKDQFVTTDNVNDFLKSISITEEKFYITDVDEANKRLDVLLYEDEKDAKEGKVWGSAEHFQAEYLTKVIDDKFVYKRISRGMLFVSTFGYESENVPKFTKGHMIRYSICFRNEDNSYIYSELFHSFADAIDYIKRNFTVEWLK